MGLGPQGRQITHQHPDFGPEHWGIFAVLALQAIDMVFHFEGDVSDSWWPRRKETSSKCRRSEEPVLAVGNDELRLQEQLLT